MFLPIVIAISLIPLIAACNSKPTPNKTNSPTPVVETVVSPEPAQMPTPEPKQNSSDIFKEEYSLNDIRYMPINFPEKDLNVEILTEDTVMEWLENRSAILYIGFPTCPWCRNAVMPLLQVAEEFEEPIYYLNIRKVSDSVSSELAEKLKDFLRKDDNGNPHIYSPDVFVLRDGVPISHHLGTVESQKNPKVPLDETQTEELKNIYRQLFIDSLTYPMEDVLSKNVESEGEANE